MVISSVLGRSNSNSTIRTKGACRALCERDVAQRTLHHRLLGFCADGAVTALVTKKAFPSSLVVDGEELLFQASDGLYRVPKAEPSPSRISELGSAPFALVVHAGPTTYIHQGEPYMPEEWSYELVRATGKPKKLELYRALDPKETPPDTGIRGLAVDDECLYTARQQKSGVVLYARSRQSP